MKIYHYAIVSFAILFFLNFAFAKVIEPSFELDFDLKKDEVLRAVVSASKDSQTISEEKNFTLRWTLYRNQGLVVLVRYDNYPYQFMLYKDFRLNSWNLNLLDTQGVNRALNQPYLKIYFLGIDDPFNDEKTIAHLRIYGYGEVTFSRQ
ncbi:hypothetical protein [Helicobacter saguini]|uniref:hypothetical protein n=1 Tax=Helicobacter saguini TaxID=1548018 RepID=UPI00068A0AAC|nr:hypothetical protein [Helicobacter saguini]